MADRTGENVRRALIVEDDGDTATTTMMLLGLWGFEAAVARDGVSALKLAREMPADVVLLDLHLPDVSGYEVAKRLRESLGGACPPLVAVTARGQPLDRVLSADAGIDVHLVKPVDPEELHETLERLLTSGRVFA
jgi:DNA-binding response OmpR family regulator